MKNITIMDKDIKQKQTAEKPAMTAKKKVTTANTPTVIVEAPSKVEAKPKKKHYRKPAKKQVPAQPAVPAKKLNWFQRMINTIIKWL